MCVCGVYVGLVFILIVLVKKIEVVFFYRGFRGFYYRDLVFWILVCISVKDFDNYFKRCYFCFVKSGLVIL